MCRSVWCTSVLCVRAVNDFIFKNPPKSHRGTIYSLVFCLDSGALSGAPAGGLVLSGALSGAPAGGLVLDWSEVQYQAGGLVLAWYCTGVLRVRVGAPVPSLVLSAPWALTGIRG